MNFFFVLVLFFLFFSRSKKARQNKEKRAIIIRLQQIKSMTLGEQIYEAICNNDVAEFCLIIDQYEELLDDPIQMVRTREECWYVLHTVVFNNRKEMLTEMIDRGCDVRVQNEKDSTAFHIAAYKGYDDILQILCSHPDASQIIDVQDAWGKSCLHQAVFHRRDKCVEILLQNGASGEIVDYKGFKPFQSPRCSELAKKLWEKHKKPAVTECEEAAEEIEIDWCDMIEDEITHDPATSPSVSARAPGES